MTTKWTPGPWRVDSRHVGLMIESDPHGPRALASISTPIDDIDRANAALIAAAPELYEALEALTKDEELILAAHGIEPSGNRLVKQARAALAKARGE